MAQKGKWLKRLVATALGGGASLVIAACYGVYQCVQKSVATGRVTYQHQGIPGVEVCVDQGNCVSTDSNGYYQLSSCNVEDGDSVTVQFRDVDGEKNGGEFGPQETTVTVNTDDPPLVDVELVPVVR